MSTPPEPVGPPRLAAWLLDRLAPRGWSEHFRGDLDEEYHTLRASVGSRANRWYWRQTARALIARLGRYRREPGGSATLTTDMRHAARSVARQRGYSTLVVLALGLSLGAAAAALAVVRMYVWTPLPYPHADRLVTVAFNAPGESAPRGIFGIDWQGVDAVADLVVAWDIDGFTLIDDQPPASANGRWIRPDVFPMFGITPLLGRVLTQDDIDQQAPVAMIGRDLWRSRFNGAPDVLGRAMTVRSTDRPDEVEVFTIVGVLPDRFWHLEHRTQVLLPLRGPRSPSLLRLREGVSAEDAATRLTRYAASQLPDVDPQWRVVVTPAQQQHIEPIRAVLATIAGAVMLLVLVTCGNLAFLQATRGQIREREFAVRSALGASRSRLTRQLLFEQALMGAAAAGVALVSAWLLLEGLLPAIERYFGRMAPGVSGGGGALLTGGVALATLLAAVAACLLSGVPPMVRVLFGHATTGVTGYLGATESRGRMRARQAIVFAQIAGTFALLAGAALMVRSAQHLADVPLGLDPDHVISANLTLHERTYPMVAERQQLIRRVTERIAALPGVEAAGLIGAWPFAAYAGEPVEADVAAPGAGDRPVVAASYAVNPAYFPALRLRILEGRALVDADATSAQVSAVVSAALAARLWPGQSAIGRTFRFASRADEMPMHEGARGPLTVVGVSADVRRSMVEPTAPEVYVSLDRSPGTFLFLQVRAVGDPAGLVPAIERAVLAEDPNLPLAAVQPMTEVVSAEGVRPRFLASVLTAFAALTAAVALVGVYAVSAWIARQRRREAAVRMALGSTSSGVVTLFVSRGAWLIWMGVVAGWGLSYLVGGLLESELHGVAAGDLTTRAALAAALGTVGVAAVWWPTWRVSCQDAATVLREP